MLLTRSGMFLFYSFNASASKDRTRTAFFYSPQEDFLENEERHSRLARDEVGQFN
jgi:hypothetical protein